MPAGTPAADSRRDAGAFEATFGPKVGPLIVIPAEGGIHDVG